MDAQGVTNKAGGIKKFLSKKDLAKVAPVSTQLALSQPPAPQPWQPALSRSSYTAA